MLFYKLCLNLHEVDSILVPTKKDLLYNLSCARYAVVKEVGYITQSTYRDPLENFINVMPFKYKFKQCSRANCKACLVANPTQLVNNKNCNNKFCKIYNCIYKTINYVLWHS